MNIVRKLMFIVASLVGSLTIAAQEIAPLSGAEWITGSTYAAMPRHKMAEGVALPLFRKVITCDAPIERATLTATALGVYDIIVNGQHVEGHELKPGWTDYRKEVTCQTMDITPLLRKGENEICAQLSYGWWAGEISRGVYGRHTPLALKAEVVIAPQVDNRPDDHPTLAYQPRITWAKAKTETPHGTVSASWRLKKNGHYEYTLTLPAGVTYELQIPHLTEKDEIRLKIEN